MRLDASRACPALAVLFLALAGCSGEPSSPAAGRTDRVSVSSPGAQANGRTIPWRPAISFDGRFVVFVSEAINLVPRDRNGRADAFLRDRTTGATTLVSVS